MSSCRTTASATRLPIVPYPLAAIRAGMGSPLRRTNGGGPKKAVRRPTVRMSRRRPRDPGSSTAAGRLAGNAPRIQLPSDPRDHRHEHGGFRESISIESPPREIPDRALFGPDSPNACHTGHCVLDGSTRFHAFDDARRVREPGSVADRDAARLVDDRDRKSTRLNSSHLGISYAVFCLKKKIKRAESHAVPLHQALVTSLFYRLQQCDS